MTTTIVVDDREATLYTHLEGKCVDKIPLSKSTLPLGDILISDFIIERKTLTDLLASIRDGRYEEQSHRLIHSSGVPRHNIIYLIEGIMNTVSANEKNLIHSTMVSLNAYKGFSVIRTSGVQETADFIYNMAVKIQRNLDQNKLPLFSKVVSDDQSPTNEVVPPTPYCNVVKKVKKENITAANIGEIVLCQIPGISSVSAVAIMAKFKTIKRLIEEVSRDPNCMSDIMIASSNGTRKISKTILANIQRFLCTDSTEMTP